MKRIRDFIYLDIDKISSIYSQLTGGLVTETAITSGNEKDERNIRKYNLKVFTPEFGGAEKTNTQLTEKRVMHHDLYNEIEELLFSEKYAIDINDSITIEQIESGEAHNKFFKSFYIRSMGWPIFEDWDKMKFVAHNHSTLMDFIKKSHMSTLKTSDEFQEIFSKISELQDELKRKGSNKNKIKKEILRLQKLPNEYINEIFGEGVEQWVIEGFSHWVDTFIQDVIYFHIYPFDECEQFHIKAALKRDCFVDGTLKSFDFAYTSRPNIKLTLFGLITSIPPKGDHPFDPMKEFENHTPIDEHDDQIGVESAFRNLFRGFDGLERMSKFERYPNITVYPLAIFRDIFPETGPTKK